jgi:CheY-like chemotaxis protein
MNLERRTPMSVLLVDDDPGDAVLVREAFARAKVRNDVVVVSDGVLALAHLRDPAMQTPDLVLLDLNLPRKDGREVLAEIRADAALTHLPVVILTTSEAESDIRRSYELHANAYVSKPTDLGRFVEVLREIDAFFASVVKLPSRAGGLGSRLEA